MVVAQSNCPQYCQTAGSPVGSELPLRKCMSIGYFGATTSRTTLSPNP